jgi:hypothetical protein
MGDFVVTGVKLVLRFIAIVRAAGEQQGEEDNE